jgi:hypothetical protein
MYVITECQIFLDRIWVLIPKNKHIKNEDIFDHTDLTFDLDKYHTRFAHPFKALICISGTQLETSAM